MLLMIIVLVMIREPLQWLGERFHLDYETCTGVFSKGTAMNCFAAVRQARLKGALYNIEVKG